MSIQAKHIATVSGFTTFENATTTVNHIIEIEGSTYMVEANCRETLENLNPKKIKKLEPKQVTLSEALQEKLKGLSH